MDCHVCAGRNGGLVAPVIWVHRIRCKILRSRPRIRFGVDVRQGKILTYSFGYATDSGRYWFKYIIVTPNQLTAGALVLQFWVPRERVNPGVFIAVFWVAIVSINYFGIRFFGEFEFWLSTIKVIIIVGVILLSLILALGGGPDKDRKGFRYWKKPGAFKPYLLTGDAGNFVGLWSTMGNSLAIHL
jgi:amino acid permease